MYLKEKGYTILEHSWQKRSGEIDIIAQKGEILVFAEVKTLPHGTLETAERILGIEKQKRIIKTAKCFLADNRQYNKSIIRFDVLILDMPSLPNVYHIKNAFGEVE